VSYHPKDKCPICGELKDVRSKRCYRHHRTKEEALKKQREWAEKNRDRLNAASRRYRKRNLEKCRAMGRANRKANPESYRKRQKRYIRRRRAWLQAYKHVVGCKFCPENDPRCLDFHHRDPKVKKYKIASLPCSFEKLREEIEKCDVVCANCHRRKTWKRRDLDGRYKDNNSP